MIKFFLILFFTFLHSFYSLADDNLSEMKQQLERINRDISDLQKEIYSGNFDRDNINQNNENNNFSELTVFDMRLRDIENELKSINLNYENLSFEIDELKKFFEELSIKINTSFENYARDEKNKTAEDIEQAKDLSKDSEIEISKTTEESEELNQKNTLGMLKINSEDLSEAEEEEANKLETNKENNLLSPEEKFQLAFDLLRSQKFNEAQTSLENFIKDYPDSNLTGSAHYWLGEIYLLKKEYREAALIFAEGYQKYPDSVKAPESLYKLAQALIKIEKKVEACDTLNQFNLKFPEHNLAQKTQSNIAKLECS